MPEEVERRMAFSGAVSVLLRSSSIDLRPASLERLIAEDAVLRADFAVLTATPEPQQWEFDHAAQEEQVREQREKDQQSWRDFRDSLVADPASLSAASAISSWAGGLWRLNGITRWVKACGTRDSMPGMSAWQQIDTAFSPEVTKQYCLAMRKAWRTIPPERPKITVGPTFNTKLTSRLAVDALELESFDENWLVALSDTEAKVAIRHATRVGTIKDRWVVELIRDRLNVVISDLLLAVRQEVSSEGRFFDVLSTVAYQETDILPQVSNEVFQLLSKKEPSDKSTLQHCIRIVINGLKSLPPSKVRTLIRRRLKIHAESGNNERMLEYLSLLAKSDGEAFATFLLAELHQGMIETNNEFAARVQKWIGSSFDSYSSVGMATVALRTMSTQSLARLLRLAYRHIPRRQNADKEEDSRVTPHELANQGRNALLEALFSRPGPEAYATFLQLAGEPEFVESSLRFKELAHKKAQNDIDLVAWKPSEVVTFGRDHSAPVKTGAQLFDLVRGVLVDIDASLRTKDASSRAVLARAENEEDVQGWLAERLNERRHGRFFAHREPEVADRNAPDIVVSANTADVQVAIEVKNANMKWTVLKLERAIKNQLSRDYLRPENRRHGILVLSIHKSRTWQFGGITLNFEQLVERLQAYASSIVSNDQGAVQLCVCVIDARDRSRLTNSKGKRGSSSPDRPARAKRRVR